MVHVQGDPIYLSLKAIPGIPGNLVAYPGQILTGELVMQACLISPEPAEGKQKTIRYLIERFAKPYANEEQLKTVRRVLRHYNGLEPDTIFTLGYSLQEGNFDETVERFERFYEDFLKDCAFPDSMKCTSERVGEFFVTIGNFVNAKKHRSA